MSSVFVEDENLSHAWTRAVRAMLRKGGADELGPVCVSVTGFENGVVREDKALRQSLEAVLADWGRQSCDTVANTIFPESLWNPAAPRRALFDRYTNVLPKLQEVATRNKLGLYFQRLMQNGPAEHPNQLDYVIGLYNERESVRRSALQVSVWDPQKDLTGQAQRGFPCLQHVTFARVDGKLNVNAFYATQYAFERAYGNYLGLCRLGRFVAHEMKIPMGRMTCFTGVMLHDDKFSAALRARVAAAADLALGPEEETL